MSHRRRFASAAFCALTLTLSSSPAFAKAGGHVAAALVSEQQNAVPGATLHAAVVLTHAPEWHTYWKNAGGAGAPTSIGWQLPPGFKAGDIQWPTPLRIVQPPVVSYGYHGKTALLVDIDVPASLRGERVTLKARIDWLECADVCIPGGGNVELTLPVKTSPGALNPDFRLFRAALPEVAVDGRVSVEDIGDGYRISLAPQDLTISGMTFLPGAPAVIDDAAEQKFAAGPDRASVVVQKSDRSAPPADSVTGLLIIRTPAGDRALEFSAPVIPVSGGSAGAGATSLLTALLFAFVGGLILNLMPCVLPVLSFKILGFVKQSGENPREIAKHGFVFAAGVLVSFLALAGTLLAIRAGGAQLGWGFQLQSPIVISGLASLFFILGLNLSGVFEIGVSLTRVGSPAKSGLLGSFMNGVLATIVATPCTAPFMGTALGFALTQPAIAALSVFLSLGIGMSTPYVILSLNPRLLKYVPKPGPWMDIFKMVMGFCLFATAVWLFGVFGLQAGAPALVVLIAGLTLQGFAVSIYGQWIQKDLGNRRPKTTALAAILMVAGLYVAMRMAPSQASATPAAVETSEVWEKFSPERVTELRGQGRAVFVDFTAAWCLTCKVNEALVLSKPDILAAFKEKNVAMLKADWTSKDETITRALEELGRSGVPVYVYYPAGGDDSKRVILPSVLTKPIVKDVLEKN